MSLTMPAAGRGQRQLALWLLCAASLVIILDGTIVTVALPSIQRDLGFSAASLSWVMDVYLIAFGSLLLLAGRLGDLIGRKRMFLSGLAAFTAASLLCGLSAGPAMLIAARFVQGIGGAMVAAVSLGMIVTLFPEPREQAKAIGAFSFVGAAGASIRLPACLRCRSRAFCGSGGRGGCTAPAQRLRPAPVTERRNRDAGALFESDGGGRQAGTLALCTSLTAG